MNVRTLRNILDVIFWATTAVILIVVSLAFLIDAYEARYYRDMSNGLSYLRQNETVEYIVNKLYSIAFIPSLFLWPVASVIKTLLAIFRRKTIPKTTRRNIFIKFITALPVAISFLVSLMYFFQLNWDAVELVVLPITMVFYTLLALFLVWEIFKYLRNTFFPEPEPPNLELIKAQNEQALASAKERYEKNKKKLEETEKSLERELARFELEFQKTGLVNETQLNKRAIHLKALIKLVAIDNFSSEREIDEAYKNIIQESSSFRILKAEIQKDLVSIKDLETRLHFNIPKSEKEIFKSTKEYTKSIKFKDRASTIRMKKGAIFIDPDDDEKELMTILEALQFVEISKLNKGFAENGMDLHVFDENKNPITTPSEITNAHVWNLCLVCSVSAAQGLIIANIENLNQLLKDATSETELERIRVATKKEYLDTIFEDVSNHSDLEYARKISEYRLIHESRIT